MLLKNGKVADTVTEKWGWKPGTPIGKRGKRITTPIEVGEALRNKTLNNITESTICKARRKESTRRKIPFASDWALRNQEGNNAGKYITVAIEEEEEEKTTVGFMREYDTNPIPKIPLTIELARGDFR